MKRNLFGILALLLVCFSFSLVCDTVWAFKNVCPDCVKVIDNLDLTACPDCGRAVNKCLACGFVNPIRNDNCENCSATLAESRVSRTIDKETRDDLQLGESPRALIEVELRQIEERVNNEGLTPELAARQVELLTQMGWWSKANWVALDFSSRFPDADQKAQVSACRVTALRNLAFLALEAKEKDKAVDYLNTALSLDPKDKQSLNLLKVASGKK